MSCNRSAHLLVAVAFMSLIGCGASRESVENLTNQVKTLEATIAELEASNQALAETVAGLEGLLPPLETGFLTVRSSQPAKVYLDDVEVSAETPLLGYPVTVGEHTLRLFFTSTETYGEPKTLFFEKNAHLKEEF